MNCLGNSGKGNTKGGIKVTNLKYGSWRSLNAGKGVGELGAKVSYLRRGRARKKGERRGSIRGARRLGIKLVRGEEIDKPSHTHSELKAYHG